MIPEVCVPRTFFNKPGNPFNLDKAEIGALSVRGNLTVSGIVESPTLSNSVIVGKLHADVVGNIEGDVTGKNFVIAPYVAARDEILAPRWSGSTDASVAAQIVSNNLYFHGNVGIGTPPGTYQLELASEGAHKPRSGTWAHYADARGLASNTAADLQECYAKVKALPLKQFSYADDPNPREFVGWLAQDSQELFANSIHTSQVGAVQEFMSLDPDQIYKTMFGALQYLIQKVEALENPT